MGAHRWKQRMERIGAIRVPQWHQEYDEKATAECDHCEDAGEWIGESCEVEPCPACGGKNAHPPSCSSL